LTYLLPSDKIEKMENDERKIAILRGAMKLRFAALYLLLFLLPTLALAGQVWPEPLPVYQASHNEFNGVGCPTPDGGYALNWKENQANGWQ
jgi:hypothetical protein